MGGCQMADLLFAKIVNSPGGSSPAKYFKFVCRLVENDPHPFNDVHGKLV